MNRIKSLRRVDIQVSILTAVIVIISCCGVYFFMYASTYTDMIHALQERVSSIYQFLEPQLEKATFAEIDTLEDEAGTDYIRAKQLLERARMASGVRYLYTAKKTADGGYIYLVDGLPTESSDFRHAGDPIEPEIIPELDRAMNGESIMPNEIKATSWGYIFISYLPIHHGDQVIGVVGIEFDAEHQYKTFALLKIITPLVIGGACILAGIVAMLLFKRLSNPTFKDLATTDLLTGLKNRNAFEVEMNNLNDSHRMRNGTVAFLSVDLDGLKKINDTMGHRSGDNYIRACAQLLQEVIPPPNMVYRIGGDEFAAIVPLEDPNEIDSLLERLNARVEQENSSSAFPLSLSAGFAIYDASSDENLYSLFDRADARMYDVKKGKKNARATQNCPSLS